MFGPISKEFKIDCEGVELILFEAMICSFWFYNLPSQTNL